MGPCDRRALGVVGPHRGLDDWERDSAAPAAPPIGFVLRMESADPVLSPGDLAECHGRGVRVIGPAHYEPGGMPGAPGSRAGSPSGAGVCCRR